MAQLRSHMNQQIIDWRIEESTSFVKLSWKLTELLEDTIS